MAVENVIVTEDQVNFDSFIRFPSFLFRLVFFDFEPLSESANVVKVLQFYAKLTYFRIVNLSNVLAVISFSIYIYVHADDFAEAAKAIPNVATTMIVFLKGLVTLVNRKKIWEMMGELKVVIDSREDFQDVLKMRLKEYSRAIKCFAVPVLGIFTSIAIRIVPFLMNGEMKLAVLYWFPFDIYQHRNFLIALLLVDWFSYTLCIGLIAADALLYALIAMIVAEFDILKLGLESLSLEPEDKRRGKVLHLKDHHNKLLNLCDRLQSMNALTFLFSFAVSSLIMCCVAFQLSLANADADAYSFYIPYLALIGGQTFLLCYFGQKLIDANTDVASGAFNSGWETFDDNDLKKQILQIVQRAQKPKSLSAMSFATISRESFATIMTATGSYFSLLKNVSEN